MTDGKCYWERGGVNVKNDGKYRTERQWRNYTVQFFGAPRCHKHKFYIALNFV